MELPKTDWVLTEPGVLVWPTTNLCIRWDGKGQFAVEWRGTVVGRCGSLSSAKGYATHHLYELDAMGIEP